MTASKSGRTTRPALAVIVGAAGGDEAKWRKALGDVERRPIALDAQSDRAVRPTGTKAQTTVTVNAVDLVREQYRYVDPQRVLP